jgi:biotin carboxyl carrier protein
MNILSELAGKVARIAVSPDQSVNAGQELLIIESMKMEIPVDAPATARVAEIFVAEGDTVSEGQLLARLQA